MHVDTENQSKTTSNTEQLRLILQSQQKRYVSTDEALEVGESLVYLYELLADDSCQATS